LFGKNSRGISVPLAIEKMISFTFITPEISVNQNARSPNIILKVKERIKASIAITIASKRIIGEEVTLTRFLKNNATITIPDIARLP